MSNPSIRQPGQASRVRVPLIGALVLAGLAVAGNTWPAVLQGPLPATLAALATPSMALLAPAAGTAVAVLVLTGLLVRRSRRARRERTQSALASFDGLHVCAVQARNAVTTGETTDDRPERVLRLRVRTLEQALEGQDERLAEAVQQGQRHAMVTLAALRQSLAHERGDVALARVEAALGRIGTGPSFARPTLTAGPSGVPPVAFAAVQPLVADLMDAPVVTAPTAGAEPGTAAALDADAAHAIDDTEVADLEGVAGPATSAAVPPVPPVPQVVRPVPAPLRREAPHRSRRRLRRTVAA